MNGLTAVSYSDVSGNEIEIQHRISENLADSGKSTFTKHDWNDFQEFQMLHAINYNVESNKQKRIDIEPYEETSLHKLSFSERSALKAYYRHKTNDEKLICFDAFEKSYTEIGSSVQ
ncbi:MAG: hypothetical protein V4544_01750 [Pseudomonadota bacterium]